MRLEYDFSDGKRGAVVDSTGAVEITIRLDEKVLTWLKTQVEAAGSGNYQTLINKALREHIENERRL